MQNGQAPRRSLAAPEQPSLQHVARASGHSWLAWSEMAHVAGSGGKQPSSHQCSSNLCLKHHCWSRCVCCLQVSRKFVVLAKCQDSGCSQKGSSEEVVGCALGFCESLLIVCWCVMIFRVEKCASRHSFSETHDSNFPDGAVARYTRMASACSMRE